MRSASVKASAVIVSLGGLTALVGWALDIQVLKSVVPGWVTIKIITAACFVMSGALLYLMEWVHGHDEEDLSIGGLPILSLVVVTLLSTLVVGSLLGIQGGGETITVRNAAGSFLAVVPRGPSIATVVAFVLVVLSGFMASLPSRGVFLARAVCGYLVAAIGACALVGYSVGMPIMFYYVPDTSSSMALNTAILFVFLGIGLVLSVPWTDGAQTRK
jgi:hypothetical protein